MIELALLIGGGVFVYSVIQSMRNDKLDESERIPTLIENVADVAHELNRSSQQMLSQTEFDREYCGWFRHFEISVSKALEFSEEKARHQAKLDADPELREIYERMLARLPEQSETPAPNVDWESLSGWIHDGPPPEPPSNGDPERDEMFREVYRKRLEKHEKFVGEVRRKLKVKSGVREHFVQYMRDWQLGKIVEMYFLDFTSSRS